MRLIVAVLWLVVAASAAPKRKPSLSPAGSAAASAGIGVGIMATDLGLNFASQTLGAVGQVLSGIPLVGRLAQFGVGLGQAGVSLGNTIAKASLGAAQAVVQSHTRPSGGRPASTSAHQPSRRPSVASTTQVSPVTTLLPSVVNASWVPSVASTQQPSVVSSQRPSTTQKLPEPQRATEDPGKSAETHSNRYWENVNYYDE